MKKKLSLADLLEDAMKKDKRRKETLGESRKNRNKKVKNNLLHMERVFEEELNKKIEEGGWRKEKRKIDIKIQTCLTCESKNSNVINIYLIERSIYKKEQTRTERIPSKAIWEFNSELPIDSQIFNEHVPVCAHCLGERK